MGNAVSAVTPRCDSTLQAIVDYVSRKPAFSDADYGAARDCLMDALGCAFHALDIPECRRRLGPWIADTRVPLGARVPGTHFELDPIKAAADTACLIRWLDFSDTWWAGGHPSDNIGGILAVADHLSRTRAAAGGTPLVMRDVFDAVIRAYEIQGVLTETHQFDRPDTGLDAVLLVKLASAAAITAMMGGDEAAVLSAASNAVVDGGTLTLYRKMPHSGPRKSWAGSDANSRAVQLALLAMRGEAPYPAALTAKTWGFCEVLYDGRALEPARPFGSSVIENIQFKLAYPAQRHAQTAAECAVRLHPHVAPRLAEVERVVIHTHQLAIDMISVEGPLPNFAARDHCLQYVAAAGLIFGTITTESYEDGFAADPRIDALRARMQVVECPDYTAGYYGTERSNANAIQVFFRDGSSTAREEVQYLIGDARRRTEGLPLLRAKFRGNLARRFSPERQDAIAAALADHARRLATMPVHQFMDLLVG